MILVDYRDLADIAASGQYRPADRERREKGSSTSNVVSGDPGAVLSGAEQVRHDRNRITCALNGVATTVTFTQSTARSRGTALGNADEYDQDRCARG